MKVVRYDETPVWNAPGQETRRVKLYATPEDFGTKGLTVGMSIYGPGMAAPWHKHDGEETMFILHGKGRFATRSESVEVSAGDLLYFPPGEEHMLECVGDTSLEFLFIYTPPGAEKPIKETWVRRK
jgi:putative monooxygenase